MNIQEVKELLAAGFTADEIRKMDTSAEAPEIEINPEYKPKPGETYGPEVKQEEKAPEAKPEKAPEDNIAKISDAVSNAIAEGFKQFEGLYNKLATLAGMPSMDEVQPKGIDDIISNFFKED